MEQTPVLLTVITPVFNGIKYIRKCLDNVNSQYCDAAEHLIMDGSSTDGTVQLVQEYAASHPHVRLISESDTGQSNAMNKGLHHARGKIVGFLNVDDYYEPNVLNRVVHHFKKLPEPSFICGNLNIWNADGTLKHFNRPTNISLLEILSHCYEWPYNPSAYFYHKSLHELTGPYNENNHYTMDYEFILNAASHIKLLHVDELWGNFNMVAGSKTQEIQNQDAELSRSFGRQLRAQFIARLSESEKLAVEQIIEKFKNPPKEKQPPVLKLKELFKRIF
jgi:glycosyltransferase involved in cell wall biosynthesis